MDLEMSRDAEVSDFKVSKSKKPSVRHRVPDVAAGHRRIIKAIGYDAGEDYRVRKAFQDPWEDARLIPWYPLVEAGIDRDGCEELIESEGLPRLHLLPVEQT